MKIVRKKILSMILSFVMVIWLIPSNIYANPESSTGLWTSYAADRFAGGTGTKEDPYQIATPEQLAKLAKDLNKDITGNNRVYESKYFKLVENIDLRGHIWQPIGSRTATSNGPTFRGFFDGNNKIISNMYIDDSIESVKSVSLGLFGFITHPISEEPSVANLNIKDATIKSNTLTEHNYAGILAGYALNNDSNNQNIVFKNITTSGSIDTSSISGGMIGGLDKCSVEGCETNISIKNGYNSGGFIGLSSGNCRFNNCKSNGNVEGNRYLGGFIGEAAKGASFENCKSSGNIEGSWCLGGFVGGASKEEGETLEEDEYTIYNKCIADVNVNGYDWRLGGFVGYNQSGKIISCISRGNVESTLNNQAPKFGGFVGEQENGSITSSHSTGKVTSTYDTTKGGGFSGEGSSGITDSSFNKDVNPGLKGVGGNTQSEVPGIEVGTEIDVNSNICEDYYGGHELTKIEAKEPTTTTDGNIEHYKCDRCKKCFKDSQAIEPIDEKDTILKATGSSSGGGGVITPSEPTREEIIGKDRYETSALVADKVGSYDTVVLVNADKTMSDGLSASSLSGKYNAPILLVKQNKIPDVSMKRIQKAKNVYIIGGTNAISKEVEKQLSGKNVTRIGGLDRYETSELIAKELGDYSKVFVVNGASGEADAMSASSVAAKYESPIILTNGKTSDYDKEASKEYYVIGGKNVVSDSMVDKYLAKRIAGEDRYETNRKVISEFYSGSNKYYVANGNTLVDALTAAILAQEKGVVLVNEKSDNSILEDKSTVQIGGFDFEI